jgi:hypothetical protein
MSEQQDPYWKLRPPPATPDDELCKCVDAPPIRLEPHGTYNPLRCIVCGLEVAPERIGFPETIADELARWRMFYDCFYLLWVFSGEFESWARAQLEDPTSPANVRGRDVASKLNAFRRTYYWWFQDYDESSEVPTHCPVCRDTLAELFDRRVCDKCSIVVDS